MPKQRNDGAASQDAFEKLLVNRLTPKGHWAYKLPDTKSIKGALNRGFVAKSPSDFIVMEHRVTYPAEVKSTVSPRGYSFSFEKLQWIAMSRAAQLEAPYFVFIHNLTANRWFKVPAKVFVESKKKSLTWEELHDYLY